MSRRQEKSPAVDADGRRPPQGTLHDLAYAQIRRWLLDGEFRPGAHLTIRTLAARLGTSSMPVREALSRLAEARALVPGANRSFRVPPVSRQRLGELTMVRATLEGLAAERAAERLLDREIERLERLNARMRKATVEQDQTGYFAANYDFHWTVYQAAGAAMLSELIEDLWLQYGPIQFFAYEDFSIFEVSTRRHDRTIAALRAKDGPAARAAMVHDITDANGYVMTHLERLEAEAAAATDAASRRRERQPRRAAAA